MYSWYIRYGGELPRLPKGTYYVIPGKFQAHMIQLAALDLARQGVDLREHGVPVIDLTDESTQREWDFDARDIAHSILDYLDKEQITYDRGVMVRKQEQTDQK